MLRIFACCVLFFALASAASVQKCKRLEEKMKPYCSNLQSALHPNKMLHHLCIDRKTLLQAHLNGGKKQSSNNTTILTLKIEFLYKL